MILDCHFGVIPDPEALQNHLFAIPGVVEHGLFLGLASAGITDDGDATLLIDRSGSGTPR